MKKTLIALTALALTGTAMAQVSITGSLISGYKQTLSTGTSTVIHPTFGIPINTATSGADAGGLGVDTSQINFIVNEDLGGGQSIKAEMALAGADRSGESGNGTVTGRDAILGYTNNSFGRIQLGTTRGDAINSGIPSAGAPVIDMDGKLFQLRSNSDFVSYTVPIGPVIFQYKLSESSNGIGLGAGSAGPAGTKVGQRTTDLTLVYLKGPLQLVGAYRSYDNRNSVTIATAEGLTKDHAIALQAGYDMGVAKLGFGFVNTKASVGPQVTDLTLGVSVPVGAWNFGATFSRSATSGVADAALTAFPSAPLSALSQADFKSFMQRADGTATGMSIGAQYNLSKRTNVSVKYATWTRSGYEQFEAFGASSNLGEFGYTTAANESTILLSHSF